MVGPAPQPAPTIKPNVRPTISAKSRITTRRERPVVTAIVRDRDSELRRGNITVKLDGRTARKGVRYAVASDRLTVQPVKPLKNGRHKVVITARDARGAVASKTIRIRVR